MFRGTFHLRGNLRRRPKPDSVSETGISVANDIGRLKERRVRRKRGNLKKAQLIISNYEAIL